MSRLLKTLQNDIHELYEYRNILRSLVAKHLYGRYRNTFLGFAWNFITPVVLMIMYYIIFTEIRESHIENKWAFIGVAIFGFHFLTSCIVRGTGAFIGQAGMIKKMYFPKGILVFSKIISSMIVCLIGYAIVLIVLVVTRYPLEWHYVLYLPLIIILMAIFGSGCVFFPSITVYVRDLQFALGSMGIILFVLTPMRYMAEDATGIRATLIWYNPLTYYVEVLHNILYWGTAPNYFHLLMCFILAFASLAIGYATYKLLKHGFVKRL